MIIEAQDDRRAFVASKEMVVFQECARTRRYLISIHFAADDAHGLVGAEPSHLGRVAA
jgi:hypothetical protein